MPRIRHIRRADADRYLHSDHWRPGPPTTLDEILGLSTLPLERGNCYGTDVNMFPKEGSFAERAALAGCKGCPIKLDCLRMALDQSDQHGVWGGMSAADRRQMKNIIVA